MRPSVIGYDQPGGMPLIERPNRFGMLLDSDAVEKARGGNMCSAQRCNHLSVDLIRASARRIGRMHGQVVDSDSDFRDA
jgi:hypothetical protein